MLGVEALEDEDESTECREAAGCLPLRRGIAIALDDEDMFGGWQQSQDEMYSRNTRSKGTVAIVLAKRRPKYPHNHGEREREWLRVREGRRKAQARWTSVERLGSRRSLVSDSANHTAMRRGGRPIRRHHLASA